MRAESVTETVRHPTESGDKADLLLEVTQSVPPLQCVGDVQ